MKNFIELNGKRIELTDEQLKQLGIEVEKKCKTPFDRVEIDNEYIYNDCSGAIFVAIDKDDYLANTLYMNCNYYNDRQFAIQSILHEFLNRKLLKFSYENNWNENLWKNDNIRKFFIYKSCRDKYYFVGDSLDFKYQGAVYFCTKEIARRAIDEIVLPFEKEHPEFKW